VTQQDSVSRFDVLSREILDGSLPYGVSSGQPLPPRFALAFEHDLVPSAVLIVVAAERPNVEVALSVRNASIRIVDQVLEDAKRFVEEAQGGDEGEMLPFSMLPRRVAIRRLKRLLHAH